MCDELPLSELFENHDEHHVGTFTITGLSYNTSSGSNNMAPKDVNFAINSLNNTKGLVSYKYENVAARDS